MGPCIESLVYALITIMLALAIHIWGRGIRNSRKSDLLAGPIILLTLCISIFVISGCCGMELIGELLMVFGVVTLLLSTIVRRGSLLKKRDIIAIGVVVIIVGLCLSVII